MPRRIKRADIRFLSLCPAGMNGMRTLYKSADKVAEFQAVTKALPDFDEKGQIVACVWAPERLDREGDWADKEAVEGMAHSFARNGMQLDLRHNEKALSKEDVFVAESFIISKGDDRFSDLRDHQDKPIGDVSGGWGVVLQVVNPALRKAYRDGEWEGVSMAGPAIVADEAPPSSGDLLDAMKEALGLNGDGSKEIDMKPEELAAVLKEDRKSLVDDLVKALKPEGEKPDDKVETKKEEVALDLTDPVAVKKRLDELRLAQIDTNDPKALEKHLKSLTKNDPEDEESEEDETAEEDEKSTEEETAAEKELRLAKERVAALEKRSKIGGKGGKPEKTDVQKSVEMGRNLGKFINGTLGKTD